MLSKTVEWGKSMNVDDVALLEGEDTGWWAKWDEKYFAPFFRYIFMYNCRRSCELCVHQWLPKTQFLIEPNTLLTSLCFRINSLSLLVLFSCYCATNFVAQFN